MWRYLLLLAGVPISLLPHRYRFWWKLEDTEEFRHAAQLSGAAEFFGAMLTFLLRFMNFMQQDTRTNAVLLNQTRDMALPTSALGVLNMAEFVLQPLNIFLLYLSFEGTVRVLAATTSGQKLGTMPLHVISGLHGLVDRMTYRKFVGPLMVDQVIEGGGKQDYDLKIYSCRPKLEWNPYKTIEVEGQFYQMFKEEYGSPPRRFIYYLRKNPVGRLVVVVDHYRIDDVLKPKDKWAGTVTLRDKLTPKWKRRPLVVDEVVYGTGKTEHDLKVYSCRRKKDWTPHVAIEFGDEIYHVLKEGPGPEPRPFVYYLIKTTIGRSGAVVCHYRPDDP
jgi:hypothetical protein